MPAPKHQGPANKSLRMPARSYARRRFRPRLDNPLTLWRTMEPGRITGFQVTQLAKRVAATEILQERRWNAARNGDAAAAVAIAMDHLHRHAVRTPLTDVVIGNLVLLAVKGDATAPVIIAHALHALARHDPPDAELPRLAQLWSRRPLVALPRARAAGACGEG